MTPLGRVLVIIKLVEAAYKDNVYIYPRVSRGLISEKAVKGLEILLGGYPYPDSHLIITEKYGCWLLNIITEE